MKKKFSILMCFILMFNTISFLTAFAEDESKSHNWYISTSGEKITEDTTQAYITTQAPGTEEEPALALVSNKFGGSQIYWKFDQPIDGNFSIKMDYYFENIGGFGLSFLTSEDATSVTPQVFSNDTTGNGFAYNPNLDMSTKTAVFYSPRLKPVAGEWAEITFNVDTKTGLVSGELADGRTFSGDNASSLIKDKTIYGITLLNQRGSNSYMKYFRNIIIYDGDNQIKNVSGAGNVVSVIFKNDMTDVDLYENMSVTDSELFELGINDIKKIDNGYGAIITLDSELNVGETYTVKCNKGYMLPSGLYANTSSMNFVGSTSACFINDFTVDENDEYYTASISVTQLLSGADDKIIVACIGEKDGCIVSVSKEIKEIYEQGTDSFEIKFEKTDGIDTAYFYIWNEKSRAPMCNFNMIDVAE